jgi:RNA polymerase sigma-70 factor (ECF subfamily)
MASDEALYRLLLAGDLRAFDALYARYERPLFGFIRRALPEQAEAEDVLHDAFLALLRDRAGAGAARSLRAWLFQVARNLCLNRQRTQRRAVRALETDARTAAPPAAPPEDLLLQREDQHALSGAVARLPDELAALYRLRARGSSYEEMAVALALPLGTVKSRMHQMVKRLREELSHEL